MTFEVNENIIDPSNKTKELIMQIESLQRFYNAIGFDSDNMQTIFSLTLGFLKEETDYLVVKSFFDVMIQGNRLETEKELNLLLCFDSLLDKHHDIRGKEARNVELKSNKIFYEAA